MKILIIIVLGLAGAGGYLYFNPEIWQPWVKDTPLQPPPTKTKLYKWQDGDGQWQVSDSPPKGSIEYKALEYSSDTNIVPSIKVEEE